MGGLVSIITVSYNNEPYLGPCIDSVLAQSYTDWELILVDNGSTDRSMDVIRNYRDPRIRVVRLPENIGVSRGRNAGLEQMSGDFFCFLDGDDLLPANSLQSRLEVFRNCGSIDFVDGQIVAFDDGSSEQFVQYTPAFRGHPFRELLSLSGKAFGGVTWMIRRKPEMRYAFKPGLTHGEELLFYLYLAETGGVYDHTTEPVLLYRRRPNSAMSNLDGLHCGYMAIAGEVRKNGWLTGGELRAFRRKLGVIMFKSNVKEGRFLQGITAFFDYLK